MFKLPEFPSIDFSALDLNALRDSDVARRIAAIDVPRIDTEKVSAFVRDAAYVTIGLGVTAFEGVQARLAVIDERVQARLAVIDGRVDAAEARVDAVVDRIENALPEQAGHLVGQARDITRVARKQVRGLLRNAA